eukprot:4395528-Amphidinium_carterae.1
MLPALHREYDGVIKSKQEVVLQAINDGLPQQKHAPTATDISIVVCVVVVVVVVFRLRVNTMPHCWLLEIPL